MGGRVQNKASVTLETKCSKDNILAGATSKQSAISDWAIQENNGLNEKANNSSIDMKEDLPKDEEENFQNGRPSSKERNKKTTPKHIYKGRSMQTSLGLERTTELRQGTCKSRGIHHDLRAQISIKVERSVELRHAGSKSICTDNGQLDGPVEILSQKKGIGQQKQVEIKKSRSSQNLKDKNINKPRKSLTFKATPLPCFHNKRSATPKIDSPEHFEIGMESGSLPKVSSFKATLLPNFYRKKSAFRKPDSPEKVDDKKINNVQWSTFKATPLPSFYHKKVSSHKPESIKISLTQSSELGNNKMDSTNNANVNQSIKSSLHGNWKVSDPRSKDSKNRRLLHVDEVEKRKISSVKRG